MKKILLFIITLVTTSVFSQNTERPIDFVVIGVPPVYHGCETQKSASNKKACSTKMLMKHIDDNFDFSVSEKTKLAVGQYNVFVSFVIDKKGNISDIKTKGNDYAPFVNEAIRLVQSIPKYASPGMHKGKIVEVRFTLPIGFIVEIEKK